MAKCYFLKGVICAKQENWPEYIDLHIKLCYTKYYWIQLVSVGRHSLDLFAEKMCICTEMR